ncbi:hypothetical protein CMK10_06175 [Candidatus Poribacteria bacterium]|jgi:hypothetical protein|nr:hypothetical protein [Candidatus Poribacteria bacterium]
MIFILLWKLQFGQGTFCPPAIRPKRDNTIILIWKFQGSIHSNKQEKPKQRQKTSKDLGRT